MFCIPGKASSDGGVKDTSLIQYSKSSYGQGVHTFFIVNLNLSYHNIPQEYSSLYCLISLFGRGNMKTKEKVTAMSNSCNGTISIQNAISAEYRFDEIQKVKFDLFSAVSGRPLSVPNDETNTSNVSNATDSRRTHDKFLGTVETTIGEIFGSNQKFIWSKELSINDEIILEVTGTEQEHSNAKFKMMIKCENLDFNLVKKNFMVRFLQICPDGTYDPQAIFTTEMIPKNHNPIFSEISGNVIKFASGDIHKLIHIEVVEVKSDKKLRVIGSIDKSLAQLREARGEFMSLSTKSKKAKISIEIRDFEDRPSFLDYIRGGVQLSFIVAVDFTASNGDPFLHDSLHYVGPEGIVSNQYIEAITSVGDIIEFYDADKKFSVYGFGGKFKGEKVNHCFPLTLNENQPEVEGVSGIISIYKSMLTKENFFLSGPTHFAEVIQQAKKISEVAVQSVDSQTYFVLLILTDGIINDMDATIDAVIDASGHPLSILIVGIGNANFDLMKTLDSDDKVLTNKYEREARRDVVQFVSLNDILKGKGFQMGAYNETLEEFLRNELSNELLTEIPEQLVTYFEEVKIKPSPAPTESAPRKSKAEREADRLIAEKAIQEALEKVKLQESEAEEYEEEEEQVTYLDAIQELEEEDLEDDYEIEGRTATSTRE